jgi:hypothetical protein
VISNLTGAKDVSSLTSNSSYQTTSPEASVPGSANSSAPATNASASTSAQDSAVSISGQAIMLSRLFMTSSSSATPYLTELSKSTMAADPVDFLTQDDRDFLSIVYSYAQSQGVDLRYVDDLATDMGMYRKFGSAQISSNSPGASFNEEGQALTYSFTPDDSASASNILSDQSIRSTQFDKGFLNFELDPGFSFNHTANFSFLQRMVEHFSSAGSSDSVPLASTFSTYTPNGQNNFVVTTASEVTLVIPKTATDNHASTVTAAIRRINGGTDQSSLSPTSLKQSLATTLLDAFLALHRKKTS